MAKDGSAGRALDDYLVASARIGDRKAFALLVERWHGKLIAHAWRLLGNGEDARDAVQDGWAEIVRGLARLADTRAFPAWAYRIVSRRCARLIGQAQGRRRIEAAVAGEPVETAGPVEPAGIEIERLRRAIAALPAEQRATVSLFHLEEMSVAEVAVALDVPAGTVKTRLMHARQKLRAALEGER